MGKGIGDRTVSIPTPVSNEEAEQGQAEWNKYWDAVKKQETTGVALGGCVLQIVAMLIGAITLIVIV